MLREASRALGNSARGRMGPAIRAGARRGSGTFEPS